MLIKSFCAKRSYKYLDSALDYSMPNWLPAVCILLFSLYISERRIIKYINVCDQNLKLSHSKVYDFQEVAEIYLSIKFYHYNFPHTRTRVGVKTCTYISGALLSKCFSLKIVICKIVLFYFNLVVSVCNMKETVHHQISKNYFVTSTLDSSELLFYAWISSTVAFDITLE